MREMEASEERIAELEAQVSILRACVPEDSGFREQWRWVKGEGPKPPGPDCVLCGLPCNHSATAIFAVPREISTPRYAPPEGETAFAHVFCCVSAFRGRYEMAERMLRGGKSAKSILEHLAAWPYRPGEVTAPTDEPASSKAHNAAQEVVDIWTGPTRRDDTDLHSALDDLAASLRTTKSSASDEAA